MWVCEKLILELIAKCKIFLKIALNLLRKFVHVHVRMGLEEPSSLDLEPAAGTMAWKAPPNTPTPQTGVPRRGVRAFSPSAEGTLVAKSATPKASTCGRSPPRRLGLRPKPRPGGLRPPWEPPDWGLCPQAPTPAAGLWTRVQGAKGPLASEAA